MQIKFTERLEGDALLNIKPTERWQGAALLPGKGSAGLCHFPPNQAPAGSAQLSKADAEPGASDKLDLEGSENNALTTFVFA